MSSTTPVTILPQRRTVQLELFEIAPDVRVAAKPAQITAPRLGIMTWQPTGDGTYKPVIETHPAIVPIKLWKEHVYGVSKFVITVLVEAGFVDGVRLSPRSLNIHLESFFAYSAKMQANPYFWSDADNRARYSKAMRRVNQQWDRHLKDGEKKGKSEKGPVSDETPLLAMETGQKPR